MSKYKNTPPKDIQNAIWGACFDYKDFDEKVGDDTIRDRIYDCWNRMHRIIKLDPKFMEWIEKHEVDEQIR